MHTAYLISPSTGFRVAIEMTERDDTQALAAANGATGLTGMRFMCDVERRTYQRDHPAWE